MRRLAGGLLLLIIVTAAIPGRAADVDWKFYGGAGGVGSGHVVCFYDERGIVRAQTAFVRVWTKCLLQTELEGIDGTKPYFRAAIDMSGSRLAHSYRPPILRLQKFNYDQLVQILMYESAADVGDLAPESSIFYELDCRQHMERELSMSFGSRFKDTPENWKYVPPEGNGARLLSLLCPAR